MDAKVVRVPADAHVLPNTIEVGDTVIFDPDDKTEYTVVAQTEDGLVIKKAGDHENSSGG